MMRSPRPFSLDKPMKWKRFKILKYLNENVENSIDHWKEKHKDLYIIVNHWINSVTGEGLPSSFRTYKRALTYSSGIRRCYINSQCRNMLRESYSTTATTLTPSRKRTIRISCVCLRAFHQRHQKCEKSQFIR